MAKAKANLALKAANAAVVALPWMVGSREERVERLLKFFEGRGEKAAKMRAVKLADEPLANLLGDCEPILERLNGGTGVEELAVEWGVTSMAIYGHLLRYAPEEFRAASANRAIGRRRECVESLEAASDNVSVSKWRALLQSAEWDLERLVPKIYGVKQPGEGLSITVNLDRSCGGVVDVSGGGVSQRLTISGAEASVVEAAQ